MKIGTRSLLYGTHQFLWHPWTVALAYRRLYRKWPDLFGWVDIFVHDLGYWGCADIDGKQGKKHPRRGADLASKFTYWFLTRIRGRVHWGAAMDASDQWFRTLLHSSSLARELGLEPSDLCWADKYSIFCEWEWFYLLRTTLSGEIDEFVKNAVEAGHLRYRVSNREWLRWYKARLLQRPGIKSLLEQKVCATTKGCLEKTVVGNASCFLPFGGGKH